IDESVELRFRTAAGEYLPFECVGQNLGDHEAVGGVAITARDLTERKRIEAALSAAEARFQAVFEHAPFSVSVVSLEGTVLDVNYAGCSMVGVPREELIGSLASDTVHPDDLQGAVDATTRQLSGADDVAEFRLVDRGGGDVWVMSSASLIDPGNGQEPYLVTIQADITERRLLEDRLAHEATRDPLTGVFNRGAFVTQLELALTRRGTKPPVLLFVDIDHFKQVNDTYGHEAGDTVLVTIARRMQKALREGDVVARLGGDEFVVLCPDVSDPSEAALLAERVRATTDRPVKVRGSAVDVGVSVGLAIGHAGDAAPALLRAADMACYRAKQTGRGRVAIADAVGE
ncbi:MAG: domain S-box/diguanylate cyclase protein, partial [Actinomycetia bacterium]|nr:domain S-box/diguanylate cyclase protein [Actinomycetes bacterium]